MDSEHTTKQLIERISQDLRGRNTGSLVVANLPGLKTSSQIAFDAHAVLLPPSSDPDEHAVKTYLLHQVFSQIGICPVKMTITRGRPQANATLIAWATAGPCLERDLVRLPLATLNLLLDSPRPILLSESIVGHQSIAPDGRAELILHDLPVDDLPEIVPVGQQNTRPGRRSLADEVLRLNQSLRSIVKRDNAMATAIHLLASGDAKWGLPDQFRTSVIEYTVALETLVLEQEAELAYRFALRASLLLSPAAERIDGFRDANRAYKLRSSAVHSGARGQSLTGSDVAFCRRLLKRCALRYLSLANAGTSRSQILEWLDASIISDRRRLELAAATTEEEPWPVEMALQA